MIIGASEIDEHIPVAVVETHAMNEAASGDISALEWFEINRPSIFDLHSFGTQQRDEWNEIQHRHYCGGHSDANPVTHLSLGLCVPAASICVLSPLPSA